MRGIHRSPENSLHKGQWRGALMFSLICVWIKGWVNNCEAGDLRRYRAHYDVTIMLSPCDLEIWWMTSKNYRPLLPHHIKLCASSQTPRWIQTGVTVRKRSIRVKINDFLSHVPLKLDGWPWKTIGNLFYATSSFVHHVVAIGVSKLELQSGNAQSGSKSVIFLAVWPCYLTNNLENQ